MSSHIIQVAEKTLTVELKKTVEFIGRFQFCPDYHPRASARKSVGIELAENGDSEPLLPSGDQGHKARLAPCDSNSEKLQKPLTEARLRLGLKRAEFALKLRISSGTLRNWERGTTQPTRRLWQAVCHVKRRVKS